MESQSCFYLYLPNVKDNEHFFIYFFFFFGKLSVEVPTTFLNRTLFICLFFDPLVFFVWLVFFSYLYILDY